MMNRKSHPYYICRRDGHGEMQFVHWYDSNTNEIKVRSGDDNNIFYFATVEMAVEVFKKIEKNLPPKSTQFQAGWYVKESVRSIQFAVEKGRTVMGYVPKMDKIILTTKTGHIFSHIFSDLSDDDIYDRMMSIAINGWERYGVSNKEIDTIENVSV